MAIAVLPDQLLQEALSGRMRAVYVVFGTETYRLEKFVSSLMNAVLPSDSREFSSDKYDLTQIPLDTVLDDAETGSMFAERKVILAEQALFLTGAKLGNKVDHNLDRL